jgi:hypothetical protein
MSVKKESVIESMMKSEEHKEEAKTLENKLRPIDITEFSAYKSEREILFAPLSSFKINSYPEQVDDGSGFGYYQIMLEYIDTFIPTKEMFFMNVTNAF